MSVVDKNVFFCESTLTIFIAVYSLLISHFFSFFLCTEQSVEQFLTTLVTFMTYKVYSWNIIC